MNKTTITLSANEQELSMTCPIPVVSDTVNYIEAVFDLGENWQGFDSVRAVWSDGYTKPIATVLDAEGKTFVPHEVMTVTRMVKVNLVGSIVNNDVLTDRLTTNPVDAVNIKIKALVNGTETAEVTPSQFEQFIAIVGDEVSEVTGMTATAETLPTGSQATASYSNGVLTIGVPKGDDYVLTSQDKQDIADIVLADFPTWQGGSY